MKIGFIGNANNYPFMLALALKRQGHEIYFIVTQGEDTPLDRPENRYKGLTPYPDWIYDLSPLNLWHHKKHDPNKINAALSILNSCDFVVLNQYAVWLAAELTCPWMALLTGTDLLTLARKEYITDLLSSLPDEDRKSDKVRKFYTSRLKKQRTGIRGAVIVNYLPGSPNSLGENILKDIGISQNVRTSFMMTDTVEIRHTAPPDNETPLIFCATRLTWDRSSPPLYTDLDYKGSDVMIKGLGLFFKRHKFPLDIHLVKKGAHVPEAMEMVDKEGLASIVTWHEEMSQQEVLQYYSKSDIIIEQLDTSVVGMAGMDAMATGRPIIARARRDIMKQSTRKTSPICDAETPEDICSRLEYLIFNKNERQRIGIESREYVANNFSSDTAANCVLERTREFAINNLSKLFFLHFNPSRILLLSDTPEKWSSALKLASNKRMVIDTACRDDVSQKVDMFNPHDYDLILCLVQLSQQDLCGLSKHAMNDIKGNTTIIFFPPSKSPSKHYNPEQSQMSWINELMENGYIISEELTEEFDKLTPLLNNHKGHILNAARKYSNELDLRKIYIKNQEKLGRLRKNKIKNDRFFIIKNAAVEHAISSPYDQHKKMEKYTLLTNRIIPEQGNCFFYDFKSRAAKQLLSSPACSKIKVYEGDCALSIGNVWHEEIRQRGKGRYSIWRGGLYFSTSDNTDPRTNQREYSIELPTDIAFIESLSEEKINEYGL